MLDRRALKSHAHLMVARPGFRLILYSLFMLIANNAVSIILQYRLPGLFAIPETVADMDQLISYLEELHIPLVAAAVLLVYNIFLTVIQVGYMRTCLMAARGEEIAFRDIFDSFGIWLKIIGLHILMSLLIFLGTLCFVVPGIILSYAYSQAFYVLIDNPDMGIIQILRRSRIMMRGHKLEFFVFQISYFFWHLLSGFIILAELYVMPYVTVGEALFYEHVAGNQIFSFNRAYDPDRDRDDTDI